MAIFKTSIGQGLDVVVLHGWCLDHRWVQPIVDQLAPHFCVTTIDLPGCGQSDWPPTVKTMHDLADQLLPQLPEKAIYIGSSIGGPIAISIAARHPDHVKHLIGIGTMPKFIADSDWIGVPQPGFAAMLVPTLEKEGYKSTLERFCDDEFNDMRPKPAAYETLLKLLDSDYAKPDLAALAQGLKITDETDLRSAFRSLTSRIDLIFGSQDAQAPTAGCEQIKALNPGQTRIHTIDGARHLPYWTHSEAFKKILSSILTGESHEQ